MLWLIIKPTVCRGQNVTFIDRLLQTPLWIVALLLTQNTKCDVCERAGRGDTEQTTMAYTKRAKSTPTGFHTNKDDNMQHAKNKNFLFWEPSRVSYNSLQSCHNVICSCCNLQHNCEPFITTFQISYNHSVLERPLILVNNYMFQFRISPTTKAIQLF